MKKNNIDSGDIFSIPMKDGRIAIAQVIWMPSSKSSARYRNIFSFAVLSIQKSSDIPVVSDLLVFKNYRGNFKVIFTSKEKIKSGEWCLIKKGRLNTIYDELKFFNNAGDLYYLDDYVRKLDLSEYKKYNIMAISGYELIEQYLSQY